MNQLHRPVLLAKVGIAGMGFMAIRSLVTESGEGFEETEWAPIG